MYLINLKYIKMKYKIKINIEYLKILKNALMNNIILEKLNINNWIYSKKLILFLLIKRIIHKPFLISDQIKKFQRKLKYIQTIIKNI